jgi:catechol 2,3-dioxygenase-like lactoylglutathione lyase family enzyme
VLVVVATLWQEPAVTGLGHVDHVALTVTDLTRSEHFYSDVLGFEVVMAVPGGRICMQPGSGFVLALLTHDGRASGPFSELRAGVDHLGFSASSREELDRWAEQFVAQGVRHSPVQDELFGSHLNFRDPDDIALELTTSNELMDQARAALSSGAMTAHDIAAFVSQHVGEDYAVAPD